MYLVIGVKLLMTLKPRAKLLYASISSMDLAIGVVGVLSLTRFKQKGLHANSFFLYRYLSFDLILSTGISLGVFNLFSKCVYLFFFSKVVLDTCYEFLGSLITENTLCLESNLRPVLEGWQSMFYQTLFAFAEA